MRVSGDAAEGVPAAPSADPGGPAHLAEDQRRPVLKGFGRQIHEEGIAFSSDYGVAVTVPDPDGTVRNLLELLDGTRTPSELAVDLERQTGAAPLQLGRVLAELDESGLLEDAAATTSLSEREQERYISNLIFFSTFATLERSRFAFQEALGRSHVLLLGVGGLGSILLYNLAGLGIGRITVVDFDVVELKNLVRQFLYTEAQVGQSKVRHAVARARELNSDIEVVGIERRIGSESDIAELLGGVDLVLAAIDQPEGAQDWVNAACVEADVPFVNGGFHFTRGVFYSVLPRRSGCLACYRIFESRVREGSAGVAEADTVNRGTGPVATLVGSLIALEAVRHLTGYAEPVAAGKFCMADFVGGGVQVAIEWPRLPDCPVCGDGEASPAVAPMSGAEPSAGTGQIGPGSRIELRPLSIVREGEEFVVGDAQTGVFLALPEVGVVAIRSLQAGHTVSEAADAAAAHAGCDVNVVEFADTLADAGLVSAVDGRALATPEALLERRTWLEGIRPEFVRPFFSRWAWLFYALLLGFCVVGFLTNPEYWPSFEDFFFYPNPAVCLAVMLGTTIVLAAFHESFHWLAGRAAGVAAWFRVSRRLFLPVFETDLSQLWSVPRRARFSPFLAGMAFDVIVLTVALGLRLAWAHELIDLPPLFVRYLGAVVLLEVFGLGFQCLVFMRTDMYAVLITAFGCRNLYRVNLLLLKSKLFRLRPDEAAEFADAHPRDRQVARWFAVVYLAGLAWAGWWFVTFFLPGTVMMAGWMFHALLGAPVGSSGFWQAFVIFSILSLEIGWPLVVFARERLQLRRGIAA